MHVKSLQKANKQLQQLEALDKEIIQIEKYALLIKDQHLQINLKLSHIDPSTEKVGLDEDGSLVYGELRKMFEIRFNPLSGLLGGTDHLGKKDVNTAACELNVSEVIALQVLGVMVAHKQAERMSIITQLNKMGFSVNI